FEPESPFWGRLLAILPPSSAPKEGVLPHPTRFVSTTGYVRGVGPKIVTQWERPQQKKVAA
ncbi:MAG: hypothetical protein ABMA01_23245, partial [Chthoniobacteraceae bacterium]